MQKDALYRAFYKSEAIIASYPEDNDTCSKLASIREILAKKTTMLKNPENYM